MSNREPHRQVGHDCPIDEQRVAELIAKGYAAAERDIVDLIKHEAFDGCHNPSIGARYLIERIEAGAHHRKESGR
jgi:hypothetical protein